MPIFCDISPINFQQGHLLFAAFAKRCFFSIKVHSFLSNFISNIKLFATFEFFTIIFFYIEQTDTIMTLNSFVFAKDDI